MYSGILLHLESPTGCSQLKLSGKQKPLDFHRLHLHTDFEVEVIWLKNTSTDKYTFWETAEVFVTSFVGPLYPWLSAPASHYMLSVCQCVSLNIVHFQQSSLLVCHHSICLLASLTFCVTSFVCCSSAFLYFFIRPFWNSLPAVDSAQFCSLHLGQTLSSAWQLETKVLFSSVSVRKRYFIYKKTK